jgi:hypothetical protein
VNACSAGSTITAHTASAKSNASARADSLVAAVNHQGTYHDRFRVSKKCCHYIGVDGEAL